MLYKSTRNSNDIKTFSDVLLTGLAPDGGLYVPKQYPKVSSDTLKKWQNYHYADLAFEVCKLFVGEDIPSDDLKTIIYKTYTKESFGSDAITPIEELSNGVFLMDLSSGPSLAFKDMAMQLLGHLMSYELERRGDQLVILGASSGDTVSAAEEAMRGKSNIKVVMLTPKDGMSPFQKAQAGSILDDNIFNISLDGRFDDCQDLVKAVNRDDVFKAEYKIGAVNSINWGRIMAQVVYHIRAFLEMKKKGHETVDIVVPSGNFGNVLAGHVAKQMGVPIRQLIVATNENKVLDHFFKTGIYTQSQVVVTSSPSMDISKASNLERFLHDLLGRGDTQLKAVMDTFEKTKTVDLSAFVNDLQDHFGFVSDSCTHDERSKVIKDVYTESGRVVDPHTAASIKAAKVYANTESVPIICLETAKPSKFEDAVFQALGFVPERPAKFQNLEDKELRFYNCDATTDAVKQFIQESVSNK